MKELSPPSPFYLAHAGELGAAARAGPVLDLACGRGRHALASAAAGAPLVLAIDRSAELLTALGQRARRAGLRVERVRADLETGGKIPVRSGSCGAILVFRFLHRPLAAAICEALRPGGLLLYETFTTAQTALPGGPRSADFLLRPGELRALFGGLELLSYWEGVRGREAVAQLAARRMT